MDLKYCERCGGLWLRETASCLAYCMACRRKLAELPSRSDLQSAAAQPVPKLATGRSRKRYPRLPAAVMAACPAEDLVLFPICEPSSGLNNGMGGMGESENFRHALANMFSIGGRR